MYFLWFVFWRESVEEGNGLAGVMHLVSKNAIVGNDAVHLKEVHGVNLVVILRVKVVL